MSTRGAADGPRDAGATSTRDVTDADATSKRDDAPRDAAAVSAHSGTGVPRAAVAMPDPDEAGGPHEGDAANGPRELPQLAPAEVVAVLAIAVLPLGDTFPYSALLLLVAAVSMLLRRRSWGELVTTGRAARSLGIGLVAGAVAVAIAAPAIDAFQVTALDWWVRPALQGGPMQIAAACGVLLATAVAMELALRGWIIVRMMELSPGPPGLPIAVAALAEALVTPGPLTSRLGVALFGAGLGTLFIGCGRNVLAPIAARCTFVAGSVLATITFGI
jgi:hypothetical protein